MTDLRTAAQQALEALESLFTLQVDYARPIMSAGHRCPRNQTGWKGVHHMGTDRELLEAAAKAAGIEVEFRVFSDSSFICFRKGGNCFHDEWNPLEDDGDALRLMVKLGLFMVRIVKEIPSAEYDADPYAATRRAAVRAAAEIGRSMK